MLWHILTPEYPPQIGGVGDYIQLVGTGLATEGDEVHIWTPVLQEGQDSLPPKGVMVHRDLGNFSPHDLWRVGKMLDQFPAPRHLLVQWVPHGYGYKSMNLPVAVWLWHRARFHGDIVDIMFHEVCLGFSKNSWQQNIAALIHRLMLVFLLRRTSRVWMSIPAWEKYWKPYALGRKISSAWLPVPSNVPRLDDAQAIAAIRARYAPQGQVIVGQFGTYGRNIVEMLQACLPRILSKAPHCVILLLGKESERMQLSLLAEHPDFAGRIYAAGTLSTKDLSYYISACDIMFQPYPDGVSTRRGSIMACLEHGKPTVTTCGFFTERLWKESKAVLLDAPENFVGLVSHMQLLLEDVEKRQKTSAAAVSFYNHYFDVKHTVYALRHAEKCGLCELP